MMDVIKRFGIEGINAINQLGAHISIYTGSLCAGDILREHDGRDLFKTILIFFRKKSSIKM